MAKRGGFLETFASIQSEFLEPTDLVVEATEGPCDNYLDGTCPDVRSRDCGRCIVDKYKHRRLNEALREKAVGVSTRQVLSRRGHARVTKAILSEDGTTQVVLVTFEGGRRVIGKGRVRDARIPGLDY